MSKYIRKPDMIDAWLWDESKETFKTIGCKSMSSEGHTSYPDLLRKLRIETPDGTMSVCKGDYIIKNPLGKFCVCDPVLFEAMYDLTPEAKEAE